jgi:tetratricopeptide (TPR) repeat protein
MGISLCMIVKNEEDWIAGTIESVRSIVSEVIIVDTGSTDATLERVRALGIQPLISQWNDSFADVRNLSISRAREPWILVLDADERVSPRDLVHLKEASATGTADGYHLIQRNYVSGNQILGWTPNTTDYEEGARYSGFVDNPLIRFFRNSPQIQFCGAVHEIVDPQRLPSTLKFSTLPVVLHHYGKVRGEERVASKRRFYLALGLKKVGEESSNAKAYFDLGIQYQELGQHAEACACFDQTFEMTKMPVALLYWAMSEKQMKQYDEAARHLKKALRLGLDTLHVHLELGNVYLAQREFSQAQAEYSRGLEIQPDNPVAAFNLGLVRRQTGDFAGAIHCYEQALRNDPAFRQPALELAVLYLQEQRPGDALRVLGSIAASDSVGLSLAGAAHLQLNHLDEAQKYLESALRKDRSLKDARLNLAQVYTRKGDHARAARYLQSVNAK